MLADDQAAIGGPAPSRVVRAWLIAQTVPHTGHAMGEFSRIELVDGDQALRVLLSAHSLAAGTEAIKRLAAKPTALSSPVDSLREIKCPS